MRTVFIENLKELIGGSVQSIIDSYEFILLGMERKYDDLIKQKVTNEEALLEANRKKDQEMRDLQIRMNNMKDDPERPKFPFEQEYFVKLMTIMLKQYIREYRYTPAFNKINLIKMIRAVSPMGLKEAKDFVEDLEREVSKEIPF